MTPSLPAVNNSNWYTSKWVLISFHILAWFAWFSFPYFIRQNMADFRFTPSPEIREQISRLTGRPFRPPPDGGIILKINFLRDVFLMGVFYLNAFKLIPSLLYQRKVGQYFLALGAILVIFTTGIFQLYRYLVNEEIPLINHRLSEVPFLFFIIAVSTTYRFIKDKIRSDRIQTEKENANLQTELSFLRSQISPHFVFNVLNNMVSLARKKSDELEPSLIRLSGLMRYMLYEPNADKVLLDKEIKYLQSYIKLQEQRFAGQVNVSSKIVCRNTGLHIEPMLLIPFVENAFKHGIGMISNPEIKILLQECNGNLLLEVENDFNISSGEIKDKTSGIGLANVKRRLDLLYENNHELLLKSEGDKFMVQLQLKLTS